MLRNVIVLVVSLSSSLAGVFVPEAARHLAIVPTLSILIQLYYCFLTTMDPATPVPMAALRSLPRFMLIKMLLVPLACWLVARVFFPEYALGALMVGGSSSGVSGPFFAFLCGAEPFFVIGSVVISSLALPIAFPVLTGLVLSLDGRAVDGLMAACLGSAFFLAYSMVSPLIASKLMWKFTPKLVGKLLERRFSITLLTIAGGNFVIFSRFSEPLLNNPAAILSAFLTGLLTTCVMFGVGLLCVRCLPTDQALSRIISISCVNCGLMVIVAAEFFSLPEVLVCTMHTLVIMSMGVPYALCRRWFLARDVRAGRVAG